MYFFMTENINILKKEMSFLDNFCFVCYAGFIKYNTRWNLCQYNLI